MLSLDGRRIGRPEYHRHVHERPEASSVPAEVADGGKVLRLCCEDGPDSVLRVAARRDGDEDITGGPESLDLVGKGVAVAVVVGDGGEGGGVRVEGERWKGSPLALKLADQLRDEVLGLHGRAAVAAGEDLPSPLVAGGDSGRRLACGHVREARERPAYLAR